MSKELDQRVVEMQFDNREFERNVRTSLGTIDKLKMALNFDGAKGLDSITQAARRMDLSNIERQTDSVRVQFSSLQVAGATMIANLTTSFMNFGKSLWNISFGQMKSGGMGRALKIEQANFKMKALAKNIDAVKNGLITVDDLLATMSDSIDRAVTGTAYGYDSAANVASQLMASGLTDANKMYDYLRAIAGAAAMTGRTFDDIGNIFTTVASNGKFMTMQLRQFSASGLNVAATLANTTKFAGKTEAAITEMISKGKIGFEDFADAMNEAFGEAAGKADETYAGVLSNVKAQLSRLGQRFAVPYIENMIPFLQKLKAAIKQISAQLAPVSDRFDKYFGKLTKWGASVLENFDYTRISIGFRSIENLAWLVIGVLRTLGDAFKEVFAGKTQSELVDAARQFEKFTEQLLPSKEAIDGLRGIFVALLTPLKIVLKYVGKFTKYTRPVIVAFSKIGQAVLSIFSVLEPFALWLLDVIDQMGVFDTVLTIVTNTIVFLASVVTILIAVLAQLFKELVTSEKFKSIGRSIEKIAVNLSKLIVVALVKIVDLLFTIFEFIAKATSDSSFFTVLANNIMVLVNWVEELAKAFQFWLDAPGAAEGLKSIIKFVEHFIALVTDFFTGKDITKDVDGMGNSLRNLGETIREMGQKFKDSWNNIDKSKTVMLLFVLTMVVVLLSIKNFIDSLTNLSKSVASIPKTITEFSKTLKNMNNMFGPVAQTIVALGATVSILTAAIKTLSAIPTEDLKRSTIALAVMTAVVGALVAVFVALEKVINPMNMVVVNNAAIDLLAASAAILILVSAVKKISDVSTDLDQLKASVASIIVLMVVLSGIVVGFSKFATIVAAPDLKIATTISALAILAFATSMLILVQALKMLEKADMQNVKENLKTLGVLMLELAVGMKVASGATWGSAASIISFTGTLITLFGLLTILAFVPMDLIKAAIDRATLIFGSFASMLLIISVAGKIAIGGERVVVAMSGVILSLVSVIAAFAVVMLLIDNLKDPKSVEKALDAIKSVITTMAIAVGALVVVYGGFVAVSKALQGWKKKAYLSAVSSASALVSMGQLLMMMAGSIVLIGIAGMLLANVPEDTLLAIEVYLLTMGVIIGAVAAITRNSKGGMDKGAFGVLVSMLLSLTLIIGALAVFQYADMEKLVISATALTEVILAIALLVAAVSMMSKHSDDKSSKKAQTSVYSIAAFVLTLAALSYVITTGVSGMSSSGVSTSLMVAFAMGMVGLLLVLGWLVNSLAEIDEEDYKKAFIGIGAINLLMIPLYAMMAGLGILSNYVDDANVNSLLKTMGAMFGVIAGLTILLAIMSSIKKVNTKKMLRLAETIALLSVVFIAVSGSLAIIKRNKVSWKEFGIAVLSLVSIVAVLGTLAALTATNKLYTEDFMAIAGSIAILGVVFLEMAAAMAIIKQSGAGWEEYGQLALMILELGVILGAMDFISRQGGMTSTGLRMIAMGAMIAIAAQSLLTIAAAMAVLKSVGATGADMIALGIGFATICAGLIAFAAIAGYFPIVSAGLIAVGAALAGFGVACVGISDIIDSVVTAFVLLSSMSHENIDTFVDNLDYLASRILEIGLSIVTIIQTLSVTLAAVVGQAFAFVITTMLLTLAEFLPAILEAVYAVMQIMVEFLDRPEVQDLLYDFSRVIGETLTTAVIGAVDGMFWTIAEKTAELFGVTREEFKQLRDDLWAIANDEDSNEGFTTNGASTDYGRSNEALLKELQESAEYLDQAKKDMEAGLEVDEDMVRQYFEYAKHLNEVLSKNTDSYSINIPDDSAILGYRTTLKHADREASNIMKEHGLDRFDVYDDWLQLVKAEEGFQSYKKEMLDDWTEATNYMEKSVDETAELFEHQSKLGYSYGQNFMGNYADGLTDENNQLLELESELGFSHGQNFIDGYTEGLTDDYAVEMIEEGTEDIVIRQSDIVVESGIKTGTLTANSIADGMTSTQSQHNIEVAALSNSDLAYDTAMDNIGSKDPITLSVDSENTDNLNASLDETNTSANDAADGLSTAEEQLIDFTNTESIAAWSTEMFTRKLSGLADLASKYNLGDFGLGNFLSLDGFKSADQLESEEYWRKKGEAIISGRLVGGQMVYTKQFEADGYKTIDDYINQNAHYGESWFNMLNGGSSMDDAKEVINNATNSIEGMTDSLGDVGSAADEAKNKVKDLKQTIADSIDMFSEFNRTAEITSREVLSNLVSHLDGVSDWAEELSQLASKGVSDAIIQDLEEAGPESYAKVHAIFQMTESEIAHLNSLHTLGLQIADKSVDYINEARAVALKTNKKITLDNFVGDPTLEHLGSNIGDTVIGGVVDVAVNEAPNVGEQIINGVVDGATASASIDETANAFQEQFALMGSDAMKALKKELDFDKALKETVEGVKKFKDDLKEQISNGLNLFEELKKSEEISADQMLHNMTDQVKHVGRWATNLATLSAKGMSEGLLESLRALGPEGADKVEAFVKMSAEQLQKANSLYKSSDMLGDYASDKLVNAYVKAGYQTSLGFKEGIDPDVAKEAMILLANKSLDALTTALDIHSPSRATEQIGIYTGEGFVNGLSNEDVLKSLDDTIAVFSKVILNTFDSKLSANKMARIFSHVGTGIVKGLDNCRPDTIRAVDRLATDILNTFCERLQIHSPSEMFAYFAEMCSLGFANQMSKDNTAINATEDKANSIVEAFAKSMLGINDSLGSDANVYQMNIVPVVDQFALNNAVGTIGQYLGGENFDISGTVNTANANNGKTNTSATLVYLSNAISNLRNDLHSIQQATEKNGTDMLGMKDAISSMKVTLDTGALVGQIANPLDTALGMKAIRQQRRRG